MKKERISGAIQDFEKYRKQGAYHWKEMRRSLKTSFNPYLHARYELALQQIPRNGKGRTAVDLGCGDGFVLSRLLRLGYDSVGIDGSSEGLAFAREELAGAGDDSARLRLEVGNVCATSLDDSSADLVVSLDVIEHLETPESLLKEIVRIAKPGALVLIGTPIRFTETPLDKFHSREFFSEEFVRFLSPYLSVREVKKSHPIELVALMHRKFNLLGRKKHLGWNLINCYFALTGRNLLMDTGAKYPTYQLAVCSCVK